MSAFARARVKAPRQSRFAPSQALLLRTLADLAFSRAAGAALVGVDGRVAFEWNGPMMHAKTAVTDGRWARVGSTNLNLASWIGNWELDVFIEDQSFAAEMEAMHLDDLARSTEIVLRGGRRRPHVAAAQAARGRWGARFGRGSAHRAATGVMRLTNTISAAISNRRELGPAEAVIMVLAAAILSAFSVIALFWPRGVTVPLAILCLWSAASLLVRAYRLRSKEYARKEQE